MSHSPRASRTASRNLTQFWTRCTCDVWTSNINNYKWWSKEQMPEVDLAVLAVEEGAQVSRGLSPQVVVAAGLFWIVKGHLSPLYPWNLTQSGNAETLMPQLTLGLLLLYSPQLLYYLGLHQRFYQISFPLSLHYLLQWLFYWIWALVKQFRARLRLRVHCLYVDELNFMFLLSFFLCRSGTILQFFKYLFKVLLILSWIGSTLDWCFSFCLDFGGKIESVEVEGIGPDGLRVLW